MRVVFLDATLELVETRDAARTKLPFAVITALRHKLVVIRAAPDERTLRNWKSLHYEKLVNRGEARSIRINKQYRLVFMVDTGTQPPTLSIIGVEDYH